jgi:hypothetical protein
LNKNSGSLGFERLAKQAQLAGESPA